MSGSAERRRLVRYLRGGRSITEDGVSWSSATRDGRRFSAEACRKLLAKGCRVDGAKYVMRMVQGSMATYALFLEEAIAS